MLIYCSNFKYTLFFVLLLLFIRKYSAQSTRPINIYDTTFEYMSLSLFIKSHFKNKHIYHDDPSPMTPFLLNFLVLHYVPLVQHDHLYYKVSSSLQLKIQYLVSFPAWRTMDDSVHLSSNLTSSSRN